MPRSSSSRPAAVRLRRRALRTSLVAPAAAATSSSAATAGPRGGPGTPHLRWGVGERGENGEKANAVGASASGHSVRRLAAAVWRLRPTEEAPAAERRAADRVGLEHIPRHLQVQLLRKDHVSIRYGLKNETSSPISVLERHSGELHKAQLHLASDVLPITSLENATKWEPENIKGIEPDGAYVIASQLNLIDEQKGENYVSSVQMELQQTQDRVRKLEAERLSAKKQLDHLFKKLKEEKAAWRKREHKKVEAIVEDMKADLEHEKKNRRQLEKVNLKLVDELKEVKMAANNLLQEYDNERKTRELTEEVCTKLVRQLEEQKAEIEGLKQDSLKLRSELDEDRKLLQMAEVWREERVQMKLVDAKLTLEAKYEELSKLQQDVEAIIASFGDTKGDDTIVQTAKNIVQSIESTREQEIKFTYEPPPASDDILAIIEELRPSEELETRETEPCRKHSSPVHESVNQEDCPMSDIFLENPTKVYSNGSPYNESDMDDSSSWETISNEEMQGSSFSRNGSEPSVNKICDKISWTSGDGSEAGNDDNLSGELYLTDRKQPKKKESAISKLWKSSPLKNCEIFKKDAVDMMNGRSSNERLSKGMNPSNEGANQDVGLSSPSIGQWSSPDSMNSQLNRGFRGCMELVQKQSLKAKLLEARMESQKIQLRHVLNQKT
ncbi:hypothetical protein E2562_000493 [Oryza meyeriana var. granulata]|uniref:Uncharacterized protein n=1 Tax=Oryza meyeriana var. granulata TaxID=110450 RepID=A0A6G1CDT0_9ORYZ|nr:hypothetical protein E2562_000493 [Oryza meyeriana var. granulata]